jgi:hypothetical protein
MQEAARAAFPCRRSQIPGHGRGRAGFSSPCPANRSRPFQTKLKLETLILCDYTHFTGKTRGANGRTVGCCHSPFHVMKGKLHE